MYLLSINTYTVIFNTIDKEMWYNNKLNQLINVQTTVNLKLVLQDYPQYTHT